MTAEAQTTVNGNFERRQSPPLEGTALSQHAIARVTYTHDAMIDLILAKPDISQNELAKHFGYSVSWVSRIRNSDAFLARLAQRKSDIVDPELALTIDERLRAVANLSLNIVIDKLNQPTATFDMALQAASMASKSLGYGARPQNLNVQTNFVVAMPDKATSAKDWASKYAGPSPQLQAMVAEVRGEVVDAEVKDA